MVGAFLAAQNLRGVARAPSPSRTQCGASGCSTLVPSRSGHAVGTLNSEHPRRLGRVQGLSIVNVPGDPGAWVGYNRTRKCGETRPARSAKYPPATALHTVIGRKWEKVGVCTDWQFLTNVCTRQRVVTLRYRVLRVLYYTIQRACMRMRMHMHGRRGALRVAPGLRLGCHPAVSNANGALSHRPAHERTVHQLHRCTHCHDQHGRFVWAHSRWRRRLSGCPFRCATKWCTTLCCTDRPPDLERCTDSHSCWRTLSPGIWSPPKEPVWYVVRRTQPQTRRVWVRCLRILRWMLVQLHS